MDKKPNSGQLIKQIHDALERQANNTLRQNKLTMVQVWVLLTLNDKEDKSCTLKELEKILNVAQSTCAGIVNRLMQKGLVDCYTALHDKRIKIFQITPAGIDCCLMAAQDIDNMDSLMLQGLTTAEKETFVTLLQKVYNNLK